MPKVTLIELDIDTSSAVKAEKDQTKAIDDLKKSIDELAEAEGDNTEAIIAKNSELRVAQKQLRENKKFTDEVTSSQKATTGSIEKQRRQLAAVTIEWKKLSKSERENTDRGKKLTKAKTDLTASLKKEEKATGDARRNVGNYAEGVEEAAGSLGLFGGGLGQASQGVKAFGLAFKTALGPVGLILAVVGLIVKALQSFFTSSEEGQETFKKLQAIFNVVFGNLNDILSNLGKKIVEFFENPKESLKNLGTAIKDNLINRFVGLLELIPNLAKAIGKLFKGEFKEAGKIAFDSMAKVITGVEGASDKIKEMAEATTALIKEQEREIAIAQALADRENKLIRLRRETNIQLAKNRDEVQRLLLITRDYSKSFDEQREAIVKANQIREDELLLKEQIAKENLSLIKSQNALSLSTIEDLDKEAEAEIALFNLRAENSAQRRELANRLNELDNRIKADQAKKDKADLDLKKLNAQITKEILDDIAEHRQKLADEALEAQMLNFENEYALAQDNVFAILELEREKLEAQRIQEVEFAEKIGADVNLINEKFAKANIEIKKAEENAKLALAGDFAGNIATIVGKGTALGKAAAVAQATISTYQGATSAYAALAPIPIVGPALGAVAAGAAIAAGLANVKKILSVQTPGGGGSTGGASVSGGGGAPPVANINPAIGQGIATRESINQTISLDDNVSLQPINNVDDTTFKQEQIAANNESGNI